MSRNRRRRRPGHAAQQIQPVDRPASSALAQQHAVEPFALFCAYHLGITEDGGYRFQNIHQVAKRFGTNAGVIKQLLSDFDMDPDAIVHSAFDMAGAQVDVMLAPEGIDKIEIARGLYAEFRAAPRKSRNWTKELAEDARANERVFGPTNRA